MRYQIPKFIFEHNRIPTLFDSSIYDSIYGFSYAGQPNLPYIMQAIFMKIACFFGAREENLFIVARMTNMLLGCIFCVLVLKISEELFENRKKAYIFSIIVLLWNYTTYIFSYVNSDAMMMVGVAVIILALLRGIRSNWKIKECLYLGLGNSLILLSYINAGGYCIISVVAFVASYFLINKSEKIYIMLKKGFLICLEVVILSGWFYINNIRLYGSIYGNNISREIAKKEGISELAAEHRSQSAINSMFNLKGFVEWVKGQMVSFCGKTIYKESGFLNGIYWMLTLSVVILFIIGTVYIAKQWKTLEIEMKLFSICMYLGIIITLGVDFYYSAFVDYIPYYARYLVPMIISLGYVLTKGASLILEKYYIKKDWVILLILLLIINIITFVC